MRFSVSKAGLFFSFIVTVLVRNKTRRIAYPRRVCYMRGCKLLSFFDESPVPGVQEDLSIVAVDA